MEDHSLVPLVNVTPLLYAFNAVSMQAHFALLSSDFSCHIQAYIYFFLCYQVANLLANAENI